MFHVFNCNRLIVNEIVIGETQIDNIFCQQHWVSKYKRINSGSSNVDQNRLH